MRLEIRWEGEPPTDEERRRIARRFRFALGRFAPLVTRVAVVLGDLSGPGAWAGRRCRAVISLPPGRPLTVEVLEESRQAAADRAADRAGLAVQRALECRRDGLDRMRSAPRTTTRRDSPSQETPAERSGATEATGP